MRYHEPVSKALKAAADLTALIQADFDLARGGCAWWHSYGLDIDAVTGIMDYLYGLVSGVRENLRIGAIHLYDLRQCRFSDDRWTIEQFKSGAGRSRSLVRGDQEARREARIDAHTAGVLRAAGSALDNLAGIVVAVGGFDTELVKADLGKLLPLTDGPDYPGPDVRGQLKLQKRKVLDPTDKQGVLLRAVRSSLQYAGPEGWLDWTRWSRNDRVHRGARITVNYIHKDKIARPLPRQPDYPEAHAYRTARDPHKLFLEEDALDTLAGIVDSLNSAIVGSFLACEALWTYRRDHPDQIVQPAGQWSNKPPRDVAFNGYQPGSATLPKDSVALVSPETGARFQASRLLDGQSPTR
ncbi:hypothetical protein AB0C38_11455 [Amycolatopsis sp. NPDC048633]|uniref:hypothetical protein n=1 Tax=Amycolatopsis sp. NPDC048633 TaxID=3157095 RepID=UPI0033F2401A